MPLHQSYHGNSLFFFMQSHYLGISMWSKAYVTSQMSQHAHQEGSMVDWKEHSIWCQIQQVQFLHLPLPDSVSDKLFCLSEPWVLPLNKQRAESLPRRAILRIKWGKEHSVWYIRDPEPVFICPHPPSWFYISGGKFLTWLPSLKRLWFLLKCSSEAYSNEILYGQSLFLLYLCDN